jgi:hypothetical protein
MPIPDVVFVDAEPTPEDKSRARQKLVQETCDALLHKQQACGKICCSCSDKCAELEAWINLDTGTD